MRVIGIDLSGPRNVADTFVTIFEAAGDHLHFMEALEGTDDQKILAAVSNVGKSERVAIGIDAPLSYNPGGGDRPSDAELRRLVHAKGGRIGVMTPTMTKMVYLTLRGITLARELEGLKPQCDLSIVEVHPGACMALREADRKDVENFKDDIAARERLLRWLESNGLKGLLQNNMISDHYVAACAAALGAWQWDLGKTIWRHPAEPPYHPYDFAC